MPSGSDYKCDCGGMICLVRGYMVCGRCSRQIKFATSAEARDLIELGREVVRNKDATRAALWNEYRESFK